MKNYQLDMNRYKALARQAAEEGCVLLENENQALPLEKKERVAVFGRISFSYYKSGLGSGGLVNTGHVDTILEAIQKETDLQVDEDLVKIYEDWMEENPYDEGQGWGRVPWSQKEMPVTEEMLAIAKNADACIVVIGRTAGEDQDNTDAKGAYRLSETEEEMLAKVCEQNDRVIVVLNVGSIIDMSWVELYHPQAVLYVWQGGQEGSHAVADILTGKVNPSGKLADTIAKNISDYPSDANFGSMEQNIYAEDVYVGYRYFETFAKEKVLYPFGYGLSYTSFEVSGKLDEDELLMHIDVKNTGKRAGKEAVAIYAECPQGKLGNPSRKLVGFVKTMELQPEEFELLLKKIDKYSFASYDDSGITGHKSCYILEEGTYNFYVGSSVRDAVYAGSVELKEEVLETLQEAYAPVIPFERIRPVAEGDHFIIGKEATPLRSVDPYKRKEENRPADIPYTGDQGYKLSDVKEGKVTMDEFIAQLSADDLIHIFRGEGMCSPKVTAGTAAAYGGLTPNLRHFGIPAGCCSDGPSGIRMDCGTKAFSLPNGTSLGCTFNMELVEELYTMTGQELRLNKIDALLGPGINIHRHPLNGRNFEYISEDPFLTGKMAVAQIIGMDKSQVAGTLKHFCGNNQEKGRSVSDSVISERALREIYLKGFEMAVKEANARSIMTTYGSVNGLWTAGSYDLCTTITRGEWGFSGIIMTDWWAKANYEGSTAAIPIKAPMIAAQNDIYMVVSDAIENPENDDCKAKLEEGYITLGELQRNAKNICEFLLQSPAYLHLTGQICKEELDAINTKDDDDVVAANIKTYVQGPDDYEVVIPGEDLNPRAQKKDTFSVIFSKYGKYCLDIQMKSDLGPLAQLPVSLFIDNIFKNTISMQGTEGETIVKSTKLAPFFGQNHYVALFYKGNGMQIDKVTFRLEQEMTIEELKDWAFRYKTDKDA